MQEEASDGLVAKMSVQYEESDGLVGKILLEEVVSGKI